jgi:hypothetical protein
MEKDDLKKFMEYDYYATPLFDGLQISLSKKKLKKSGNTDIFLGSKLCKIVDEFVPLYHAKCKEFGEEPQVILPLDFNHIVPYCSAVAAASCFDDIIACILYLQDHFGKYEEEITDNVIKSDALIEIAKRIDDDPVLRQLIGLYGEIVDTVDKIIMLDYKMGGMVLDENWQDIADALNVYVDKLNEANLANELNHFTADDACEMSKLADLYAVDPFIVKENGKYGLKDIFDEQVLPCEWDHISEFHEGLAVIVDENKGCGYIDIRGDIVIPCIWDLALDFEGGYAVVSNNEHKYGIINRKGEIVIPCTWRFITPFKNGIAKAQDFDKHWFLVDMKGEATRTYTYMERKEMGILTEEELKAESEELPFPSPYPPVADFGGEEPGPF